MSCGEGSGSQIRDRRIDPELQERTVQRQCVDRTKLEVQKAMINYEGKFLAMEANKSGFEGDRDDESNYTSIEFLSKSLFEDVKKEGDAKTVLRSSANKWRDS